MKKKTFVYGSIGTLSHGTMRDEDLIPCFCDELERLCKANQETEPASLWQPYLERIAKIREEMETDDYFDSEDASFDLNDFLFDALSAFALPYFYFGAHPGDGSDYGFWLHDDVLALNDFDGLKVSDLSEVPFKYKGEILLVNDHRNVSLYYQQSWGKPVEVWSAV